MISQKSNSTKTNIKIIKNKIKNTNTIKNIQTKTNKKLTKISIGAHASITPNVLSGLQFIKTIGGNTAQIFLGSNRSSSLKTKTKFTDDEIKQIKSYLHQHKMTLIVHSIYLLNFAYFPPHSRRNQYAHDNLQHDLKYAELLGARCVVLHFGFSKKKGVAITKTQALDNMIANVNHILSHAPKNIKLALETSAGQGSQIGSTLEDIKYVWDGIYGKYKKSQHVGICIDTAHIFVGGYDISNQQGMQKYLDEFNKLIGVKNITNFHINDSRYDMGSRHDEHRGLQHGKIFHGTEGLDALKYLVEYSKKHKIPMILETHGAGSLEKPKSRSKSLKHISKHISKHTLSHSTIQNLADNTYEGEIALIKSLI